MKSVLLLPLALVAACHIDDLLKAPSGNGVARFTDLSINQPGGGYTLRATASGPSGVESNPITIRVP